MSERGNHDSRGEVFSVSVRAGKRKYFFDVKATRSNEYYLTITESKKRFGDEGDKPIYEKHKIFLYREDFEKFLAGLNEAIQHIRTEQGDKPERSASENNNRFSDIDYDDLGGDKEPPGGEG
jgi:hypothetical protein